APDQAAWRRRAARRRSAVDGGPIGSLRAHDERDRRWAGSRAATLYARRQAVGSGQCGVALEPGGGPNAGLSRQTALARDEEHPSPRGQRADAALHRAAALVTRRRAAERTRMGP